MIPKTFDEAFESVKILVSDFRQNEKLYLSPSYSEQQARLDFIDKFWIALGWDVKHDTQKNPYEQEVKVERSVTVGTARKRADYAFLASNFRDVRFYVEAKKPHSQLDTADNYFQTIRYGWNSQTLLAVLMDFEQFCILDCRYKPDINTALNRALKRYHYTDYADKDKFAEIYFLFSREAVINSSIEKHAEGLPKPKGKARQHSLFATGGYQSVDESFLQKLDEYREALAHSFKNRNPHLGSEELTEITQRTLDRLVFMRFLEDKLIEVEPIVEKLGKTGSVWRDFVVASTKLDRVYNGIIFNRHEILDSSGFRVDDKIFGDICKDLSYAHSPYNFNAIPIHILGSIYERFLGKTIIATDKRARVKTKPEVIKAGGVYYTPEYIVRYIVENTVGKLIKGKSPEEISRMRFADIACGSGSFLLSVYDLLLRYHTDYYNTNKKKGSEAECRKHEDGTLHLSLRQRREILLNNIYGVDIDAQAVEVAQLSLYLKMLEDETTSSAKKAQLELSEYEARQALLPSLNKNIFFGNSLIGWDILEERLFEMKEERKLNPMSFEQAFPDITKAGGFDVMVGNPPYGAEFDQAAKDYLNKTYKFQNYQLDSYLLFVEKAITSLLKDGGFFGVIIPNPWLTNLTQRGIRSLVAEQTQIHNIVHFKFPVFPKVTVDTEIVILQKASAGNCKPLVLVYDSVDSFLSDNPEAKIVHDQRDWQRNAGDVINIFLHPKERKLIEKVSKNTQPLELYFEINVGIKPYQAGKGTPPQTKETVLSRPFDSNKKETKLHRQYLRGSDITRFLISPVEERFLKYGPWLAEPRPAANFDAPVKMFMRQTGDSLIAALDDTQYLCLNNMHVLVPRSKEINANFFLGVLNSQLLNWFYQSSNPEIGEALAEVKRTHVASLPIREINFSDKADKASHDRIIQLVEQMIGAKKRLAEARTDKDKTFYESKCAALDHQIDQLVYELYGLTDKEISIVEEKQTLLSAGKKRSKRSLTKHKRG